MTDLIRDAPIGQLIRWVTNNRVLLYPEEKPDFQCPTCYADPEVAAKAQRSQLTSHTNTNASLPEKEDPEKDDPIDAEKAHQEAAEDDAAQEEPHVLGGLDRPTLLSMPTARSDLERHATTRSSLAELESTKSRIERLGTRATLQQSKTREELEEAFAASILTKEPTRPIIPQRTADGYILVDWYTEGDAENPQNWSAGKKFLASLMIYLYTTAVYMGSSIITAGAEGIMREFHVGPTPASLDLALYTLAYGLGPLIFSPLSEIPSIGRNPPYMITMGIFVILCVPTALVENFAGLLVLRFLQGFFGSPCLATGGASLQDMYSLIKLPYVLCIWAFAATCGPVSLHSPFHAKPSC